MSRRNYGRQYFNQPQQAPYGNRDLPDMTFASYTQPYLYQDHSYEYYGVPYTPSPNIHTANSYWCGGGLGYDYSTVAATPSVVTSSFSSTHSSFSPDAPEFVSRQSQQITTGVENAVLQPSTKKKKKKKKKTPSINKEPSNLICSGDEEKTKSIVSNPNEKKSSMSKKLDNSKITGFQELPEDKKNLGVKSSQVSSKNQSSKDTKGLSLQEYPPADKKHLELKTPHLLPKTKPSKEPKSVRFQESTAEDKKCFDVKNPQISTTGESAKGIDSSWPKPFTNVVKSQECIKRPSKMSFADKLKSPVPTKSPFLDWRDQRTSAANAPIKFNTNTTESEENLINRPSIPTTADETSAEDGFTTVSRKKAKDKKIEKAPEEIEKSLPTKVSVPAEEAKKKLEKERKKLREKQKKKQAREEKLLAEKLAPKGQKITIITPKLMEQFLKSGRNANAFSKPVMKLSDEMFPALGKRGGKVSESESEWETTEIEVVQKEPAVPPRNVKRSDPIEFDLMALITKKNTKKKSIQDPTKKGKNRPGIVANVLDRSAPTLSRGKIRNKKRKLSEIRKALLVAKAKKKIARESQLSAIPSSGSRSHALHSKKFREYCDQMLTDQIDLLARDMLYHLRMFQDRVFKKDPIKARMKKRLIAGLREVTKQVERNRVKIIFLAPDIQRCPETGGLDEAVKRLLDAARRLDLPIVYALSRRKLGRVLFKKVPVSCCGILNYQATEETWKQLTEAVSLARENYQLKLQELGLAVDLSGKETKTDENIRLDDINITDVNIAAFTVEKKTNQTDALLELMKLSLKDKH